MNGDSEPLDPEVRWRHARRRFIRLAFVMTLASTGFAGLLGYAVSHRRSDALGSGYIAFVAFAGGMIVTYLIAKRRRDRMNDRSPSPGTKPTNSLPAQASLRNSGPGQCLGSWCRDDER